MRVTVSCAGRFHAFNLVEELFSRGHLDRFITTTTNEKLLPNRQLPAALKANEEFKKRLTTIPSPEYLGFGIRKLPISNSIEASYVLKDNLFDRAAAKQIKKTDIFVGWAHQSLFQLREAKTRGAITIVERGSTHIDHQQEILDEERVSLGLEPLREQTVQRMIRDKQLKEYHECDHIMVPSQFARQTFIERGFPAAKILTNPYGVDLVRFHPTQQRNPAPPGTIRIISVGPLSVQKGTHRLLAIVKALRSKGVTVQLTVVGALDTEFKPWLEASGMKDQITHYIPFLAQHDLVTEYHKADVLCLPSVQEGLALVIAEAMACGVVPVVSDRTGGEEFVSEGVEGYVLPFQDESSFVERLRELSSDRYVLMQMQDRCVERAQAITWDAYGQRAVDHYEAVLERDDNTTGSTIDSFYDEYWDRNTAWTPTHSFTDHQLEVHFDSLFKPTDSVLDVGCGDARNYQSWLVKQVRDLNAIDISESGVKQAKRIGLDARVHDFSTRFPFETGQFDKAVCIEVLEHLYDPKFCVAETFRILKPGGMFILSVPNNGYHRERLKALFRAELSTSITDMSNEWKGAHIRFYNQHSLERMLEVCGFEIEEVRSNDDGSVFDALDAIGGFFTQHFSTMLRRRLPSVLKLGFLQDVWPSLFAPHLIVWARKPVH